MTVFINGNEHPLTSNLSINDLLTEIGLGEKPVVVELNQKALFPREYPDTTLRNGDRLEIITIAAGG